MRRLTWKRTKQYLDGGFYDVDRIIYHLHRPEDFYQCTIISVVDDQYTYQCPHCKERYTRMEFPKPLLNPDWFRERWDMLRRL